MLAACGQRDVVRNDHHLDLDALGARDLGGEAEIEAVARVVLDDQQHARGTRYGTDCIEHGVRRRRGEHFTGHRCAEHARADVARVCRFMA